MKKLKSNAIVLVFISIIVLFFVLKDNFQETITYLSKMNFFWILIAIVCMLLYLILKSIVLSLTVNQKEKHYTLSRSFKHNMIAQFFNGVTPFSTGGQPMEVYMLRKHGKVSFAESTNLIMQSFIFYQIALVLFGLAAVIVNCFLNLFASSPFLDRLIVLGFLINTIVAIFLLLFMFAKRFTHFLLTLGIKILSKLHFIKDKEKVEENWKRRLSEFNECAKDLKHHPLLFVKGTLYHLISLFFFYAIPLFIAYAMGDFSSINLIETLIASAYVLIIGSFVPIPGASGGIEYGFLKFFGVFFQSGSVSAMLLVWRAITYYFPMIIGAILFSFDKGDD